jgi:hypothetical protein
MASIPDALPRFLLRSLEVTVHLSTCWGHLTKGKIEYAKPRPLRIHLRGYVADFAVIPERPRR